MSGSGDQNPAARRQRLRYGTGSILFAFALLGCAPKSEGVVGASAPQTTPAGAEPTDPAVYRGAGIARQACVACHDIGVPGAGPATPTAAPDFVLVANQPGMTRSRIETWLRSSHPTMPVNYFGDATVGDLAAYIMYLRHSESTKP